VVEYYATDAVGSVRVVFNENGQVVARADYFDSRPTIQRSLRTRQPFGELSAPVGELPPQQFTGQARDGEAGLDYFGARFYQPRHGRFTQVDPVYAGLFDPQQWNRYTYARANPLSFVDPDGRQAVEPMFRSGVWEKMPRDEGMPSGSFRAGVSYPGSASTVYTGPFGGLFTGDLGNVFQEDAGLGLVGDGAGWLETIRDVADVISVVDPTPVSNLVSAGASLGIGEVGTAAITVAGVVPVLGAPIDAARGASAIGRVLNGLGRLTHARAVGASTVLEAALAWLGPGYREIAPGVFRSSDAMRRFRMTTPDLVGSHGRVGSHVHFESLNSRGRVTENLHVPVR
jgi:RHS repeat-associated protein